MRLFLVILFFPLFVLAQKKPLDHSVYDGWQSIGERIISNNGEWVVYTVTPQEGDAELFIQSTTGNNYKKQVARGYAIRITEDSRYLIFKIRPAFSQTRDARIKKKKPEDLPKDSIGIIELGKDSIVKIARIKSFKIPGKAGGWLAYHKEREMQTPASATSPKTVDSLKKTIDSLVLLVTQLKNIKAGNADGEDADEEPTSSANAAAGSDLVLRNLQTGKEKIFRNVSDYLFSENGQKLALNISRSPSAASMVLLMNLQNGNLDTLLRGSNDSRNFVMTEDGSQLAFLAERDTTKSLQKFYGLYLYRTGDDSAALLVDKKSVGMQLGMTVSENGSLSFSKSGERLFFGTAPVQSTKDTSLIEMDLVKLDIWNYQDDYLQTQQLFQLNNELKRSYLAMYDFSQNEVRQLGSPGLPNIISTNEGDGDLFIASTDTGRRVESQWTGRTKRDVYALDVRTGKLLQVKKNFEGIVYPSSTGRYILLYDFKARNYFAWDRSGLKNISSRIRTALYNEENDIPNEPAPYGIMAWHEGDSAVYVYDRYDVWKIDLASQVKAPALVTNGRSSGDRISYRYLRLDNEERFLKTGQPLYFRMFDNKTKKSSLVMIQNISGSTAPTYLTEYGDYSYNSLLKARDKEVYVYTRENFIQSPDLYYIPSEKTDTIFGWLVGGYRSVKLSQLNPQQKEYNWGTAHLYQWKAFNGKAASGILYKPEGFDATKKYPMLIYFYERHSNDLNNYQPPAPTGSRINIPFFVSRGYLVFTPDIAYTKGHPGKDAYTYVVSGAQSLARNKWVDAANIGIQGQSWGGYQVAHLITATNMFKAAWAGAPVVNMFSAYGGIRWESGNNRQFQYEKGQSRIGATPWENPALYIENSPLFHLKNVNTPLVIMANDADGAVPWYQGIEFFTAMRRLGKKVWMLNYNGEAHNLVERKNKKDIQIRQQQYFDWLLKGEAPPKWITEGVPAVRKGKDWGLELVY